MKIVIDIPESVVTAIQIGEDYRYDIHTAIAQGVHYEARPHGEWIPTVIDTRLYERSVCREWKCSNCGEVVKMKYPFCHCGADMRSNN